MPSKIMGILNVTPDSFSDGNKFLKQENAVKHGVQMKDDGADIIDIGGESTRPRSKEISLETELKRVLPVIKELKKHIKIPISIDTTKFEVASKALESGANIINDISGGKISSEMFKLVKETKCKYILCHWRGKSEKMDSFDKYENIVNDVIFELDKQLNIALSSGVKNSQIIIDPNLGFSKVGNSNWEIIDNIEKIINHFSKNEILIGHSRKRFLNEKKTDIKTANLSSHLSKKGVDILRVHNVKLTYDKIHGNEK